MYSHLRAALQRVAESLKSKFPDNLAGVHAFGSKVRGDHTAESDFDVLIIVKNRTIEVEEEIIESFVLEELHTGISFDPVIKTVESFELERQHNTPFYQNVTAQGIQV